MRPDELEPMSEAMKALLEAERPLDAVPAATRAKLFAKVSTSLAGIAAAGAGTGAATGGAAAAAGGKGVAAGVAGTATALSTKVIIAAVAFSIGGGVGAGVHAVATPKPVPPPPVVLRVEVPVPAEPPPPVVVEADPVAPPAPVKVVAKRPDNLGAERSLIETARAALSRHEAASALSALAQHEREYPDGQLAEERLALQVLAYSETSDAAKARELAAKFRERHPGSLLMPAVDAASPP